MPETPTGPFSLVGKTALVTGAARGIGLACAWELGRAGARVVVADRSVTDCAGVAAALEADGVDAVGIACDVTQPEMLRDLAAGAQSAWGGIDVLVCNAGVTLEEGPIAAVSDAGYDQMMEINLRSTMRLCNLVIPPMAARGGGTVVIVSSIAALRGNRRVGVYGMSKAANAQLARNLAVEWAASGVRVNAVAPGLVMTAFTEGLLQNDVALARRLERTPMGRIGTPREIATTVLFLASPASSFVTGHVLVADGGTTIGD